MNLLYKYISLQLLGAYFLWQRVPFIFMINMINWVYLGGTFFFGWGLG